MNFAAFIISILAQGTAIGAIIIAYRTRCQAPKAPTREDRIARARAAIEACKGAELALEQHASELPAAIILSGHRSNAAHAKQELRTLGVEVSL